jgi:23S rRNA pseudouridine1911/1915/1917 synthase
VHSENWTAQALTLDLVYEDGSILVVNKPAGRVVHPAVGNRDGTLVNALLYHAPELDGLPRAGIVHRLDKDTTGLLVVARTLEAHRSLVEQLQARRVTREYDALVTGEVVSGGTVDAPMGRHPVERIKMAVVVGGKAAITHYRVLERYAGATLLRVRLETGRTHQIRVHMAHITHPVVGDQVYGGHRLLRGLPEEAKETVFALKRQALHATRLELAHPESGKILRWQVPRPTDFETVLAVLRQFPKQDDDW